MDTNSYYIMTFDTTTDVMQAESLIKQDFPLTVMPVPNEISSGCGLALRFMEAPELSDLLDYLGSFSIHGCLYQMGTEKENGLYPVGKISEFPKPV